MGKRLPIFFKLDCCNCCNCKALLQCQMMHRRPCKEQMNMEEKKKWRTCLWNEGLVKDTNNLWYLLKKKHTNVNKFARLSKPTKLQRKNRGCWQWPLADRFSVELQLWPKAVTLNSRKFVFQIWQSLSLTTAKSFCIENILHKAIQMTENE